MNRSRRAKRDDYVSDLVLQVARSPQELAGKSRWALFEDAISAIANLSQLALTTSEPPHELISLSRLTSGSEQRLLETFSNIDLKKEPVRVASGEAFPLSSGEISFMKFAAQASLHIENGSLLLLDEPETHLHPNFISKFIKLLNNLLSATGSAAIIATHSAYFVREVFREQVNILSIDSENNVISQPPNLRTFGADVGSISYFVFGEDEPSLLASEVIDRILDNNFSWDEIYNDYKDELSLEALNTIRASLPGEVKS
jgi:ATPase subunit of ABC transporter with duplicated ATPase domains